MQTTVKKDITIKGVGLHSGRPTVLRILPAAAEYGVWFRRTDVSDRDNLIPALYDTVNDTKLCTRLSNDDGVEVSTVEHLMAALAGTGIHNAMIEVEGPEVPIMDGSSAPFVAEILRAGIQHLNAPVRAIRVLKEITVAHDDAQATLKPAETLEINFEIDFKEEAIGEQKKTLEMVNGAFVRELSNCRTFCRLDEVEHLQSLGLGLGGSLDNAIVVDRDMVLNPDGFRHDDECVRHKMLDALGDLALAGAPIMGRYEGSKAGHHTTNLLLRALFADPTSWEMVTCNDTQRNDLPGANIKVTDFAA